MIATVHYTRMPLRDSNSSIRDASSRHTRSWSLRGEPSREESVSSIRESLRPEWSIFICGSQIWSEHKKSSAEACVGFAPSPRTAVVLIFSSFALI